MEKSSGAVWVIAEREGDQILSVSTQLIGRARYLADELGTEVGVILLGNRISGLSEPLISMGADTVFLGEHADLDLYQADLYREMIVNLVRERQPDILLLGSTFMGRELAPLLAASLKTGLTAHCVDLTLGEEGILEQRIPAYGGMISIICPERRPQMATVASGVFPSPEPRRERKGDVVVLKIPEHVTRRTKTVDVVLDSSEGVKLETASIIVAGGAGAGDKDGWALISDFAQCVGAGLGCTRPVVDEGWSDLETMIGQSGKMVSPDLYIGIGLSGELQHMVGISEPKVMVAINNDAKAPVFDQVDLGVVDDCRTFIPILMNKIRALQEEG